MQVDPVGIGEYRVETAPGRLAIYGLGSCVAVFLYDGRTRTGGLGHCMLPFPPGPDAPAAPGRYVGRAIDRMLAELAARGGRPADLVAKLVGGASMFRTGARNGRPGVGERNVAAARAHLAARSIPLRGEDVGGGHGRTLVVDLETGRVRVRSLRRARIEL